MARVKPKKGEMLSLEQVMKFLATKGIKATKANEDTVKLPYVFGTELEIPATEIKVLNAFHIPIKLIQI